MGRFFYFPQEFDRMKLSLLALALAAAAPLSAQAAGTQYNYVEGGYASTRFAGFDFNGWNLDGSVAFNDHWYGTASYTNGNKSSVDLSESTLGLGYRHNLSDKSDFIAEANFVADNADFFDNESGYRVAAGFRGMLGENVEGTIKVNYTDVNNYGKGWGANAKLVVNVSDTWGFYGSYDYSDRDDTNLNTWGVGVRVRF
jgi:hypothetical protein